MRQQDDLPQGSQITMDAGFVLEHIKSGSGDSTFMEGGREGGLINDGTP